MEGGGEALSYRKAAAKKIEKGSAITEGYNAGPMLRGKREGY